MPLLSNISLLSRGLVERRLKRWTRILDDAKELTARLEAGDARAAAELLSSRHRAECAQLLRELPSHLRARALLSLVPTVGADVLAQLPDDIAAAAVMEMQAGSAASLAQELQTDEEADLLQDVSAHECEAILRHVDRDDASIVRQLMGYAEDSSGGLTQREFIAISTNQRAGDGGNSVAEKPARSATTPPASTRRWIATATLPAHSCSPRPTMTTTMPAGCSRSPATRPLPPSSSPYALRRELARLGPMDLGGLPRPIDGLHLRQYHRPTDRRRRYI